MIIKKITIKFIPHKDLVKLIDENTCITCKEASEILNKPLATVQRHCKKLRKREILITTRTHSNKTYWKINPEHYETIETKLKGENYDTISN